jgi:hypothetical protein
MAKRYAESVSEQSTLLARNNRVADLVLGEQATVAVLGYDYTGSYWLPADHPLRPYLLADAPPVMRLAPEDPADTATSVFAALRVWRAGELDEALLGVADDRFRLLLLCWKTGAAVAPYDGGVDLFFPSPDDRERARPELAACCPATRRDYENFAGGRVACWRCRWAAFSRCGKAGAAAQQAVVHDGAPSLAPLGAAPGSTAASRWAGEP